MKTSAYALACSLALSLYFFSSVLRKLANLQLFVSRFNKCYANSKSIVLIFETNQSLSLCFDFCTVIADRVDYLMVLLFVSNEICCAFSFQFSYLYNQSTNLGDAI